MKNNLNSYKQQIDIAFHQLEKSHPKNAIVQEKQRLNTQFEKLQALINQKVQSDANKLTLKQNNLIHHDFKINSKKADSHLKLNNLSNLITSKYEKGLSNCHNLTNRLNTLSPLATLSRGYSITLKQDDNSVITSSSQITRGDKLETIVESGKIVSEVIQVQLK